MPIKAAPTFVSPQSSEDSEADPVAVAVLAIFESRNWVRTDKNGHVVADDAPAKNFVYALFRDEALVNSEADIVEDGLSASDVFAKTFPRAPGATSEPVDDDQFQAYQTVKRKLWQWSRTTLGGYCQDTAEMEGLDYVMCEKKVYRASRDSSTGTGEPKQVAVRFFTQDADLIFALSSQPAAAKLVKIAEETAKHLQMNTARHPELRTRVAKEAQAAISQSQGHLKAITAATGNKADGQNDS